ncbi:MAG: thiamine-binding protein [Chloroflexi bacterium]|nr:thiamine-binding protein [Chloroflexota bacterium]
MIVEIQCLPTPIGNDANPYAHVDAAIKVIQDSGLTYEVDALGTTFEGDPDRAWPIARAVHDACLAAGARSVVTIAKFAQARELQDQSTISSLTSKFRGPG